MMQTHYEEKYPPIAVLYERLTREMTMPKTLTKNPNLYENMETQVYRGKDSEGLKGATFTPVPSKANLGKNTQAITSDEKSFTGKEQGFYKKFGAPSRPK